MYEVMKIFQELPEIYQMNQSDLTLENSMKNDITVFKITIYQNKLINLKESKTPSYVLIAVWKDSEEMKEVQLHKNLIIHQETVQLHTANAFTKDKLCNKIHRCINITGGNSK